MNETKPILIDLNDFTSTGPGEENRPKGLIEMEPSHSLGFTLTPMAPAKRQKKLPGPGIPGSSPELLGRLESHRIQATPPRDIAWQAREDKFWIGGPTARLDEEEIVPGKDKLVRASAVLTLWLYHFSEYVDLRVILEVQSHSGMSSDHWIQFFLDNKMVGKLNVGAKSDTYLQEFRFTGQHLPHQSMTITSRLASAKNPDEWRNFYFNEAQVRVYDPQVANK